MKDKIFPILEKTENTDFLSKNFQNKTVRHESINFDEKNTENFVSLNFSNPLLTKLLIIDNNIEGKLVASKKATINTLETFIENFEKRKHDILQLKKLVNNYNPDRLNLSYKLETVINDFFEELDFISIEVKKMFELKNELSFYLNKQSYLSSTEKNECLEFYSSIVEEFITPYIKTFFDQFENKEFNFKSSNILFTLSDIEKSDKINEDILKVMLKYIKQNNIFLNRIISNYMIYSIDSNKFKEDGNISLKPLLKNIENLRKKYNINTIILGSNENLKKEDFKTLLLYTKDNNIKIITNNLIINFQKLNKINAFINSLLKNKMLDKGILIKNYFTNSEKLYSFDLLKIKDFSISYFTKSILGSTPMTYRENIHTWRKYISLYDDLYDKKDFSISIPKIDINVIDLDISSKNELNSFGFIRRKFNTDFGFSKKNDQGITVDETMDFFWYLFQEKNVDSDNVIENHEKSKFLLMDIILKLYRNEVPYLNNPIGEQIESYNDFSKIFFEIKKLEEEIFEKEFMKLHLILWLCKPYNMLPDWKNKESLGFDQEIYDVIEKIGKTNYELFMFQAIKLYSLYNGKENNISVIKNLLSNSIELFLKEFKNTVQEGPEYGERWDVLTMRVEEGYAIFDPNITEHINDSLLTKISARFEELFKKVDILTTINFELNKLFNFKSLDQDFDKIIKGDITAEELLVDEDSYSKIVKSIIQIKSDPFYLQMIENYKVIAFDKNASYQGKILTTKEKQDILKEIFDIKSYYKNSNLSKSHADEILSCNGKGTDYIKQLIENEEIKFSKEEKKMIEYILEDKKILSPGNNFENNVVFYFNKIYEMILEKIQNSQIDFEKFSYILDNLSADLINSEDLFQLEKVAFSYESIIYSNLDRNFIVFDKSDLKSLYDFESDFLYRFNDIEENDIENFAEVLKNIIKNIKDKGKFYLPDYSNEKQFIYYSILKLFSNHWKTIQSNSILSVASSLSIIENKLELELVQTTIKDILYNTKYQRDKLIELNEKRKTTNLTDFESNSNKKFLQYYIFSLKSIVEKGFEKLGTLNFFRIHKQINNSIAISNEKTLFGVFKDVLVNYLAEKYDLTSLKDNSYTLLLSFDNYLSDDILIIFKKLSAAINKNIIIGVSEDFEQEKVTSNWLISEEQRVCEIYKVFLTENSPKTNENKYDLIIEDNNLVEGENTKLIFNEELFDIKLKKSNALVKNRIIELDL
ncbi:hypothetical protein RZR97_01500 [Hydrogenimonas thermophila]|uniref:hypothetical protein n=1 Tax=Hydrogenimonas thermophila TaxID=223786 RepID=UPI002936DE7F|nr:hypothetical protein [Hydrogenimonas thermophila]WOE70260.1 hypothetical protein RZR91_01510 [Hydrogenimonas thermophila]WOE72777.1 hypothetical protein RZR97_01500 [Hydrogenimonas thermophila]